MRDLETEKLGMLRELEERGYSLEERTKIAAELYPTEEEILERAGWTGYKTSESLVQDLIAESLEFRRGFKEAMMEGGVDEATVEGIFKEAELALEGVLNGEMEKNANAFGTLVNGAKGLFNLGKGFKGLAGEGNSVGNFIKGVVPEAHGLSEEALGGLSQGATRMGLGNWLQGKGFKNTGEQIANWGKGALQGEVQGLQSAANAIPRANSVMYNGVTYNFNPEGKLWQRMNAKGGVQSQAAKGDIAELEKLRGNTLHVDGQNYFHDPDLGWSTANAKGTLTQVSNPALQARLGGIHSGKIPHTPGGTPGGPAPAGGAAAATAAGGSSPSGASTVPPKPGYFGGMGARAGKGALWGSGIGGLIGGVPGMVGGGALGATAGALGKRGLGAAALGGAYLGKQMLSGGGGTDEYGLPSNRNNFIPGMNNKLTGGIGGMLLSSILANQLGLQGPAAWMLPLLGGVVGYSQFPKLMNQWRDPLGYGENMVPPAQQAMYQGAFSR